MRVLVQASFPHEPFNAMVRAGTAGDALKRILADTKPEAVYFTEVDGKRTAIFVVDLKDASRIPAIAEPWFLTFGADVRFHPTMTPDDLARAGLEELGKKWGKSK
jgi:hypothetical protein